MTKKFILFSAGLVLSVCTMAQSVVLRFSGVMDDGAYVRMDSVKVLRTAMQATNRWVEVISAPDTVISFGGAGIGAIESGVTQIVVAPNPAKGHTLVSVEMDEPLPADVWLYNVSGQKVVVATKCNLTQGSNLLDVRMGNKGLYLLTVATAKGKKTVKLLNANKNDNHSIVFVGKGNIQEKRASTHAFNTGDSLVITGFATIGGKMYTSRVVRKCFYSSENVSLLFILPIQGMASGAFSMSDTHQVRFSRSNLQWSATGTHAVLGGGTAAGTWRFAPNPYDTLGTENINASSTYSSWISLFCWGTSGYNNCYPYLRSAYYFDYANDVTNIAGTNYDWGRYNAISNGGNQPGLWRTPTEAEWHYLIEYRDDASNKLGSATVEGVSGLVLLPDEWTMPNGMHFTSGVEASTNIYTAVQWDIMEAAGAVFLPVEGLYVNQFVYSASSTRSGKYWTSTRMNNMDVHVLVFTPNSIRMSNDQVVNGNPVRLVRTY